MTLAVHGVKVFSNRANAVEIVHVLIFIRNVLPCRRDPLVERVASRERLHRINLSRNTPPPVGQLLTCLILCYLFDHRHGAISIEGLLGIRFLNRESNRVRNLH